MTNTRLTIRPPADFDLARDTCSYGHFLLAPNHWDPETQSFFRVLTLDAEGTPAPATCRIRQISSPVTAPSGTAGGGPPQAKNGSGRRGSSSKQPHTQLRGTPSASLRSAPPPSVTGEEIKLRVSFDRALTRAEQAQARVQIARMLSLDTTEAEVRDFHRLDPRWKKTGECRLFRSPTLFEDFVKTVTSCNVAWPSTVHMNARLCQTLGKKTPSNTHAFPTPQTLARTRPATLRARCRVGYRDQRIVELAKLFRSGKIETDLIENPDAPDAEVFKYLKTLPGIGPYAAANIMQLAGRYSHLALDTESVRHAKMVLGYEGTDRELLTKLADHYEPFGRHKFRSYWFELWRFYERKVGLPAHRWERETTATAFTAKLLNTPD